MFPVALSDIAARGRHRASEALLGGSNYKAASMTHAHDVNLDRIQTGMCGLAPHTIVRLAISEDSEAQLIFCYLLMIKNHEEISESGRDPRRTVRLQEE